MCVFTGFAVVSGFYHRFTSSLACMFRFASPFSDASRVRLNLSRAPRTYHDQPTCVWMALAFVKGALLSLPGIVTHIHKRILVLSSEKPTTERPLRRRPQPAPPCIGSLWHWQWPAAHHAMRGTIGVFFAFVGGEGKPRASGPPSLPLHGCGFLSEVMRNILMNLRHFDRTLFKNCGANFFRQWP